jgi:SOS-response transcriptional repressor LexA
MLTFIENFITGHGYGPSYREIMSGMGYSSVATVAKHVDNLISRGHLRKKDNSARSLEVVKKTQEEPLAIRGAKPTEAQEKWLIKKIEEKFDVVEAAQPKPEAAVDELKTLVEALSILDLSGAHTSFSQRLASLKSEE